MRRGKIKRYSIMKVCPKCLRVIQDNEYLARNGKKCGNCDTLLHEVDVLDFKYNADLQIYNIRLGVKLK